MGTGTVGEEGGGRRGRGRARLCCAIAGCSAAKALPSLLCIAHTRTQRTAPPAGTLLAPPMPHQHPFWVTLDSVYFGLERSHCREIASAPRARRDERIPSPTELQHVVRC